MGHTLRRLKRCQKEFHTWRRARRAQPLLEITSAENIDFCATGPGPEAPSFRNDHFRNLYQRQSRVSRMWQFFRIELDRIIVLSGRASAPCPKARYVGGSLAEPFLSGHRDKRFRMAEPQTPAQTHEPPSAGKRSAWSALHAERQPEADVQGQLTTQQEYHEGREHPAAQEALTAGAAHLGSGDEARSRPDQQDHAHDDVRDDVELLAKFRFQHCFVTGARSELERFARSH